MKYEISMLSKALQVAARAHSGQVDKSGEPYILHPLRVAFDYGLEGDERIVGLLHDVLEDTPITYAELLANFGSCVAEGVASVSRGYIDFKTGTMIFKPEPGFEKEVYVDFVKRAAKHPLGKAVKIADLKDNLSPERMNHLPESEKGIARRYQKALEILGCSLSEQR